MWAWLCNCLTGSSDRPLGIPPKVHTRPSKPGDLQQAPDVLQTLGAKHRELRAAQPLALNQKEEKNFENWHGPYLTFPIRTRPCEALG